jgi:hypothetical protein
MAYLLDSNVFIEAKLRYYGFDFHPAFWDWLVQANADGMVYSVEKVAEELGARQDELTAWASDRGTDFFLAPTDETAQSLVVASAWANTCGRYEQPAVAEFLTAADYYLVAHALAHDHVVVTHETREPMRRTKIKIPDACDALGVQCMTTFEMFRATGTRFVGVG